MASDRLLAFGCCLALAVAWAPGARAQGAPPDGTYRFGPGSEVRYRVVHKLHAVNGRTGALEGALKLEKGRPVLPLTLTVPLATLSSGNANRDANARAALGVLRFPEAELTLTRVTWTGGPTGTASGQLALRGERRAVEFPFRLQPEGAGYRLQAEFPVSLTAYGIPRPSLMFVPVEDEVSVSVSGLATKQP